MRKIVLVAVVLVIAVVSENDEFVTFPMDHMRLSHLETPLNHNKVRQHHLRHFTAEGANQTYPLYSLRTIFTINLNVNGFDYNLSIDTGSSDFFIKGETLEGNPQKKFSCPLCIKQNQYVSIDYLDGKLDTYIHNSTVKLGRHEFNETILIAYSSDNIKNFKKVGGIVGLSFQEIAHNPSPNFINTLIKQNIIKKYRFGLKLNFKEPQTSFITFGGIDRQYIDPEHQITYYNILQETFSYKLEMMHLQFGDKQLDINIGLLDSGNTCVSIPDQHADDMLEELNKGGNECQFKTQRGNNIFRLLVCIVKNFEVLPVISVVMPDERVYTWQKQYYIDKCLVVSEEDEEPVYKCSTFIQSVSHRDSLFLGAGWMLKYYAVFDLGQRRIGMAKNRDNPTLDNIIAKAKLNSKDLVKIKQDENVPNKTNLTKKSDTP